MKALHLVALALIAAAPAAAPAQSWPTKPVRFIIAGPPGVGPDIVSRMFAEKLTRVWGQQIIVDNRGANTLVGAQAAAKAPNDGYTFLFGATALAVINPYVYKSLPYDPAKDFVPVALIAKSPFVLVVNGELPVKSVADLVALAKKQPGKLSFASGGNPRGLAGMLGELFKVSAGIDAVNVPHPGTQVALQETVAGRVQYTFDSAPPITPFVKNGRLRAIAVTGPERMPGLEDVPTLSETYPGFEYYGWYLLFAPTGVPAAIVQRVNRDIGEVMKDPDIVAKVTTMGSVLEKTPGTPKSLNDFLRQEEARWSKAVKAARIEPE